LVNAFLCFKFEVYGFLSFFRTYSFSFKFVVNGLISLLRFVEARLYFKFEVYGFIISLLVDARLCFNLAVYGFLLLFVFILWLSKI